jgi:hypothetical protein
MRPANLSQVAREMLFVPKNVRVFILGDENGPTEPQSAVFIELSKRIAPLVPSLQEALFEESQVYRKEYLEHVQCTAIDPGEDELVIGEPPQIWRGAFLERITVSDSSSPAEARVDVSLGFGLAWDPEHAWETDIREWTVVEVHH